MSDNGWKLGAIRWAITAAVGGAIFLVGAPAWVGWMTGVAVLGAVGCFVMHKREGVSRPRRRRPTGRARQSRPKQRARCSARCRRSTQPVEACRCKCGGRTHGRQAN